MIQFEEMISEVDTRIAHIKKSADFMSDDPAALRSVEVLRAIRTHIALSMDDAA